VKSTLQLSPDAYTRFQTVLHLLKKIISQEKKSVYKIVDVGGSSGFLEKFLKNERISYELTIIDPLPRPKELSKSVRYIQAGAEMLPTMGEKFDVAIAIDVLEHLPGPELKDEIVSAMAQSVEMGLIIVGPFDTERTDTYEHQLNDINKLLFKVDQNWLAEHFECGKPNMAKTLETIKKANRKLALASAYTLPFDFWLESSFVNLMPYASYFLPKGRVEHVNATFNEHFSKDIENSFVMEGYRGIIVASKNHVKLKIESDATWPYTNQYVHLVAELLSVSTKQTNSLRRENSELKHRIDSNEEAIRLTYRVAQLETSNAELATRLEDREKTLRRIKETFPISALLTISRAWRSIRK
jgi:hypothetical protein